MTRSRHTRASLADVGSFDQVRLGETWLEKTSRRAWTRPMTVRPFGDAYIVECDDGTYYVSLAPGRCSCGEDTRENHCQHVRRVAIEINLGRVPPPAEPTVECQCCDRRVVVSAADDPPPLCAECHLEPGDVVVDARDDSDTPLLVVSEPGQPAGFATVPGDEETVAEYPENESYPPETPVVEVVYPHAVSTDRPPRRYLFPLARLHRPNDDRRPSEPSDRGSLENEVDCD